ncbi:hypothetical protein [Streptomyces roseoverticillatus]|uniref:hypothetical protein n=1 Tax=Streptomyces roseoverticillatus TaxID=66429 RepID=UPI000A9BB966
MGVCPQHAEALADLVASEDIAPLAGALDVICGIGTQALPLTVKGYQITGPDPSERAVARARREAAARGLDADRSPATSGRLRRKAVVPSGAATRGPDTGCAGGLRIGRSCRNTRRTTHMTHG